MPSFRFRGFAASSVVALTVAQGAQSAGATLVWEVPAATPNATFEIERVPGVAGGAEDIVAPFAGWFRATNLQGFAYQEPNAPLVGPGSAVYDITQHRITYVWTVDNEDYAPLITPNIPTAQRNLNLFYGKNIATAWHTPGVKNISCFAFDDQGNWGTASFQITVGDPDTFYTNSETFYLSDIGEFPAGATNTYTDIAAFRAGVVAYMNGNAARNKFRMRIRRGGEYTSADVFDFQVFGRNGNSYQADTYGPAELARPIINVRGALIRGPANLGRRICISGIDFKGEWDSATETGRLRTPVELDQASQPFLISRCRFSGMNQLSIRTLRTHQILIMLYDCEVTDWSNYGLTNFNSQDSKYVLVNCDIHCHEDALSGVPQGTGSQEPTQLGNRHGCFRYFSHESIFSQCSFFNRVGWSNASDLSGTTRPPSAANPVIRQQGADSSSRRHYYYHDRCSFEGSSNVLVTFNGQAWNTAVRNTVFDKCLFKLGHSGDGFVMQTQHTGTTIRNSYYFLPVSSLPARVVENIQVTPSGTPTSATGPFEFYNNTILSEAPVNMHPNSSTYAPVRITSEFPSLLENNVFRVVHANLGADVLPLGTTPLEGFVARDKGARWNFPPVNHTLTAPLPQGEWVEIPWPTWGTAVNNGQAPATPAALRTAVLTNSTQKHQVSFAHDFGTPLFRIGRNRHDVTLYPEGNPGVEFDFSQTDVIRLRHALGATATFPAGVTIWIQLDLSDILMDFIPGTGTAGPIPWPVPGPTSAAFSAGNLGRLARDDFFGNLRGAQPAMGAFQPGA